MSHLDRYIETNTPSIGKNIPFEVIITKMRPEMLEIVGPDGIDFLRGLLRLDPEKRFTATQALAHPFITSLKNN